MFIMFSFNMSKNVTDLMIWWFDNLVIIVNKSKSIRELIGVEPMIRIYFSDYFQVSTNSILKNGNIS